MRWEQPIQYASISDIGFRRRNNQDRCAVHVCPDEETFRQRGHLFLVADGMGGHAVGELASKIAVDTLPHTFYKLKQVETPAALQQAIEAANQTIYDRSSHNRDFERMGTTCTALVLSPAGAIIGHVGDSRAYRVREGRIDQLTFDHSLQWELLRQGNLTAEEIFMHQPRNVITRSLGPEPKVCVDLEGPFPVLPGDTYLLCSDGLTGHVQDSEIGAILTELPPAEACRLLVNLANLRGGSDNITVVVARVGDVPAGLAVVRPAFEPEHELGFSWAFWLAVWAIAAGLVLSVTLALFQWVLSAAVLFALSVGGAVALGIRWWETRPLPPARGSDAETTLSRPYRTAPAEFCDKLLAQLAAIEAELQRTALEENWSIDWARHEAAYAAAKQAITAKNLKAAFRHYARSIDVLMAGVQLHRKQMNREARWGKSAAVEADEPAGSVSDRSDAG